MHYLIPITPSTIGTQQVNSVNARDLYKALELKKDFSDWIKAQIRTLDLGENIDYLILLPQKVEQKRGGHNIKEYILTLDTAKHIAMASRTKKGKEVRAYFIEAEKRLNALKESGNIKEIVALKDEIISLQKKLLKAKDELIKELQVKKSNRGNFDEITARLKLLYNASNIKELVKALGIKRGTYDSWRNKGELPTSRIYSIMAEKNITKEWLLYGGKSGVALVDSPAKIDKEQLLKELEDKLIEKLAKNPEELILKLNGKAWAKHYEHYIKTGEIK